MYKYGDSILLTTHILGNLLECSIPELITRIKIDLCIHFNRDIMTKEMKETVWVNLIPLKIDADKYKRKLKKVEN